MRGRAALSSRIDSPIRRRLADAVIDRYCEWREECETVWTSDLSSHMSSSSNEIGSFESGVAAKLLGTVASVIFGGLMTLGVVGVTAWKIPALGELDELD